MKLAFVAAAWLGGVLIGLETRTTLAPVLLLLGGSVSMGLALHLSRLPVFPAVLALLLVLGVWRADSVSDPGPLPAHQGTEVTRRGNVVKRGCPGGTGRRPQRAPSAETHAH